EFAADRNQQAPERHVVGHAGESHGAQEDRVVLADLGEAVLRHHLAVLLVVLAAPRLLVPGERETELPPRGFQHALAFGDDFHADAVSGDDCDLVGLAHAKKFSSSWETSSGTSSGR